MRVAVAGTAPQLGAGALYSGAPAGWWTDHPSAGWVTGMRRSRASDTPLAAWWIGLSKRQAAVGDDRAGRSLRPTRIRSQANGRKPGRPAPPQKASSE